MKDNDCHTDSSQASSRRRFLAKAAIVVAASGASATEQVQATNNNLSAANAQRREKARKIRQDAATAQSGISYPNSVGNGDETGVANFAAQYSKALPHNEFGEVDSKAYRKIAIAANTSKPEDYDAIPLGGTVKLANPQAGKAWALVGGDSHHIPLPPPPRFSSAETAGEMVELYLHALLRDVAFDRYAADPQISFALNELNKLSDFKGPKVNGKVTPQTLFRTNFVGDTTGGYISQYLLQNVPYGGAMTFEQKYRTTAVNDDHLATETALWNNQKGLAPQCVAHPDPTPGYLTTGRDLAEFVHSDFSCQACINAALILLAQRTPTNQGNPYRQSTNQTGFVTLGATDVLAQVAEVSNLALRAAWHHKWNVHRRIRPEAFGGRVQMHLSGKRTYPIHRDLLSSGVLVLAKQKYNSNLLPQAYPEGSPTHPAYPSGHASIAGACVTVLKAFFDTSGLVPSPIQVDPTSDGLRVLPLSGPAPTVEGELNKLASNLAIGRNLAGVHWRSDAVEGMLMGEEVAIRYLRDQKLTYNENLGSFTFRGLRGNTISI